MPWDWVTMKVVQICEKLRGADKKHLIRKLPNGETYLIEILSAINWIHRLIS